MEISTIIEYGELSYTIYSTENDIYVKIYPSEMDLMFTDLGDFCLGIELKQYFLMIYTNVIFICEYPNYCYNYILISYHNFGKEMNKEIIKNLRSFFKIDDDENIVQRTEKLSDGYIDLLSDSYWNNVFVPTESFLVYMLFYNNNTSYHKNFIATNNHIFMIKTNEPNKIVEFTEYTFFEGIYDIIKDKPAMTILELLIIIKNKNIL